MELLIHQFPDGPLECKVGNWISCDFHHIPTEVFFITNFEKSKTYYFQEKESIELGQLDEFNFCFSNDEFRETDHEEYIRALTYFKQQLIAIGIKKAIFSRVVEVNGSSKISYSNLLKSLISEYRNKALIYLISSEKFGTWIGATPEYLVKGNNKELTTLSLAGTKKYDSENWTKKELEEQKLVTDFVRDKLNKIKSINIRESEIETIFTGSVYHLCTRFNYQIDSKCWKKLLDELHPTPAVGGEPRKAALKLIRENEKHERKLYTGMIGFYGKDLLNVYVNLRCMQIIKSKCYLYVGGGITTESDPINEWKETENKAKTLIPFIKMQ